MAIRVERFINFTSVPAEYVRPVEERPLETVEEALRNQDDNLPVIDMQGFDTDEFRRQEIMREIGEASKHWGVFQIINHGVPSRVIRDAQAAGHAFLELPLEDKEKYANNPAEGKVEGYGTKLATNVKGHLEWMDYFFHTAWPRTECNYSWWPAITEPVDYKTVTDDFIAGLRGLATKLLGALSVECGAMDSSRMEKALGGDGMKLMMKINNYPICPQPELALGVEAHTDVSSLTFLVHNMVPGLQIFQKESGKWVTARCVEDAILVHIGDQIETMSNGIYTSALHRGLVNKEKVRVSWAIFCEPPRDAIVGPLPELLLNNTPPQYPTRTFQQHMDAKLFKKNQPEGK